MQWQILYHCSTFYSIITIYIFVNAELYLKQLNTFMKKSVSLLSIIFCITQLFAQNSDSGFRKGYLLKGADTIICKFNLDFGDEKQHKPLKAIIENDEIPIYVTGPFTGFGYKQNNKWVHYGAVEVELNLRQQQRVHKSFVEKIVAGSIDLYEYVYLVRKASKVKVDGEEKTQPSTSSWQEFTDYYIGKTDVSNSKKKNPVILPSFRKKDIEPYVSDYTELAANLEKKYKLKELIVLLNEYNLWAEKNKKK